MSSIQLQKSFCKPLARILQILSAIALLALAASGHAKMLRSEPANGANLPQPPAAIELTFNEPLQATGINEIIVTDANGNRVDRGSVALVGDGAKMRVEIQASEAGVLTVSWKALSADDHLMKGEFSFKVSAATTPSPSPIASAPPALAPPTYENPPAPESETPPAPIEKSGSDPLQSLARWFSYLSMMTLFGGFAFLLFVVEPSLRGAPNLDEAAKKGIKTLAAKRFLGLTWISLAIIFIAALAGLILQTSAVLETGFAESLKPFNFWKILTGTGYGMPFFLQISAAALVFVIVLSIARRQKAAGLNDENGGAALFWAGLIFSALMLASLSLTGHARAAQKNYPLAVASDWIHLIASGVWVGGIFQLVLMLPQSLKGLSARQRLSVLSRVIPRFGTLAVAATLLLALTGIYNSWIHLTAASDLVRSPYGITLLVKIALFLLMLPLGGFNRFFMRPRVERVLGETVSDAHGQQTVKDFYFVMILEAAFAAAILLLAAILAFLPHSQNHHAAG